jgi:site-specific recombinase XerD
MSKQTHSFNWVLDPGKFLSEEEAKKLLETAKERAKIAVEQGRKIPVRDYFIVDLAMSTGLRVMEMALLACGDIFIQDGRFSLLVRRGKNGKRRLVRFNSTFKDHYEEYIEWKKAVGEAYGPRDPLLLSSNTGDHLTTRAIQKAFKRTAAFAGLSIHYAIHCLRHTYACQLYKASSYNLRLVQKQLGHSSIRTTEVYADVMEPDIQDALRRLYK